LIKWLEGKCCYVERGEVRGERCEVRVEEERKER
jgi:hypothetical protein